MIRGVFIPIVILCITYRLTPFDLQPPSSACSVNSIFMCFRRPMSKALENAYRNPSLFVFCILLAGDVQTNPGPSSIYPCGMCDQEVTWQCKGICCENEKCEVWFHHSCVDVDSAEYVLLGRSNVQWLCPRCDSMNCDSFTFNSFELSCHNSFPPLALIANIHQSPPPLQLILFLPSIQAAQTTLPVTTTRAITDPFPLNAVLNAPHHHQPQEVNTMCLTFHRK